MRRFFKIKKNKFSQDSRYYTLQHLGEKPCNIILPSTEQNTTVAKKNEYCARLCARLVLHNNVARCNKV